MSVDTLPAVDISVSSLVRRPVAEVAAHAIDPDTTLAWQPHVLGRRIPLGFEVVEFEPEHKLVLRTGQGPVEVVATYTWVPRGTWTEVTLRQTGDLPGVGLAAPLLERALHKAMSRDLMRLVNLLEAKAA